MNQAMASKRLLFVGGGSNVYGLEMVVLKLVKGLAARGYDVFCTASGWNDGVFPRALADLGVPFQPIHLGWYYASKPKWSLDSLWHAPRAFWDYRQLLSRYRPDLVFHSSYRTLALLSWMVAHSKNVMLVQDRWDKNWEWWLLHRLNHLVRGYVASSDYIRDHLVAHGLPGDHIQRIHNAAEFGATIRSPNPSRPRSVPTLGLVGQIIERKGHQIVMEALARIRERYPALEFQLKIFGTGTFSYVERIKALAYARGVAPFIQWYGYKKNHDEIYPEIDFGLVPTTDAEPFGLAAIEPAVYGKPVIASATGGLREIVKNGETGLLTPPSDPDALADRLVKLITDPGLVRALGERAYDDYRIRFNEPRFVDQYCQVAERLLDSAHLQKDRHWGEPFEKTCGRTSKPGKAAAKKQRLLFVVGGDHVYGFESRTLRLIRGLKSRGYDVFCAVSGWSDGDYSKALERIGIPYEEIHLGWYYLTKPRWTLDSLRHAPQAFADYRRIITRFRPNLVFHGTYRTLTLLGSMVGPKNVVLIPDLWSKKWEWRLIRYLDHLVPGYIVNCEFMRKQLIGKGLAEEKIHMVYNAVEFDDSIRRVSPTWPRDIPTFGIIGQVVERKGHHIVIEAMARIREKFPALDFRLKIFGAGSEGYMNRVKQLAAARNISQFIEWCGYKKNRDDIYPEIDFGLVPTVDPEPFAHVTIEPAIYGKPVIASTSGGFPEIVKDGETGCLVAPSDPDALADRIVKLITDPALVKALGERAYTDYRRRFNEPRFVDDYCRIIDGLIAVRG